MENPFKIQPLILECLHQQGIEYGQGIMKWVRERTRGELKLTPATVVPVMNVLEARGLVERTKKKGQKRTPGRQRVYFRLTPEGRKLALKNRRVIAELFGLSARTELTLT